MLAFDLGADDYVVKPSCSGSSRHGAGRLAPGPRQAGGDHRFDTLEIRVAAREVTLAGEPVALSRREFELLAYLASRVGEAISREQLLRDVWQSSGEWHDTATVTEHIRRIRRKIEPDPARPRWIHAVRNVGYRVRTRFRHRVVMPT